MATADNQGHDPARVLAKRVHASEEAIALATEIKLRAERKAGEILAVTPKADGGDAQRTRYDKGTESPSTLADLGVTKKESSRYQNLAA